MAVLHRRNAERLAERHAVETLRPTSVPLEIAAKEYAPAWAALGGKASLLEAAREFARRHLHELPDNMLPDAVKERLEAKEREGARKADLRRMTKIFALPSKKEKQLSGLVQN